MKNIISLAIVFLFFSVEPVWAGGMSQAPIQSSSGVAPPNVMFTLDDSGSMGFECLPDNLCIGGKWVGTMPDSIGSWKNGVATYDKEVITTVKGECIRYRNNGSCSQYAPDTVEVFVNPMIFNRKMRSASINPLYYNPNVLYLPWLKVDGSRYVAYIGVAARDFPEDSGSTAVQNLVAVQNLKRQWCTSKDDCNEETQNIYLAQYFNLTGANIDDVTSYTQVKIQSGNTYPKSTARTDCTGSTCTYEQELQNFSNWYSYHRTRMRVAIAGTAEAFYSIPGVYRVGYGRINKSSAASVDGSPNLTTVEAGVRTFGNVSGGSKTNFYSWLFAQVPRDGGTPLRRALDAVGQYYSYTDNKGPWGATPGTASTTPQLACRRSFHLLMTDGMWNGDAAVTSSATANVDGSTGPTITGPNAQSYTYSPINPFKDDFSNTLADISMYYWNRDLNYNLANEVKVSAGNPAFWQHMVNYTISFGVNGTLNSAADLTALTSGSKSWPQPGADEPANIDDLWHAAINSRGKYLSARNTLEYSNALKSIIDEISAINGSESGVAVSSKTLSAGSRKYETEFSSARWNGEVKSVNLTSVGADNSTAWTAVANMPTPGGRKIFTYNKAAVGAKGLEFTWGKLTSVMRTTLFGSTSGGEHLVSYLRGDRTLENGTYRPRTSVLGDIVNSAPVLIKDQVDGQYDFLPSTVMGKSSYRRFLNAKKLREAQLFVGANDGMLHAFSDVNGAETFAFMPDSVLGTVKNLASLDYTHQYFVDGPLAEADVYDVTASKWRNLVLGGTGTGAKSLFAINVPVIDYPLDATATPAKLTIAQSAPGASDILWNISNATTNFDELGYVLHTPEHGVMRDGTWVVISGNGYESTSGKAQLFVINAITGDLIKKIDTGVGSTINPNGLGGVRVVRNTNRQIVAAYAGDLMGNMWKFDLSSDAQSDWQVAFGTTGSARNSLYTTAAVEPITAAPTFALHPKGGVMVLFGTGQLHTTGDEAVVAQRALYGIWDKVAVGATSTTASARVTDTDTIVAQALTVAALTGTTGGLFYGLTVTPVDYATKRGWRIPLTISSGQRLVDDPEMVSGLVFMQSVTPSTSLTSCTSSNITRYGFLLDPFMKSIEQPIFDTNADTAFTVLDGLTASAFLLTGNGPATVVRRTGINKTIILQTGAPPVTTQSNRTVTKRYWRQIITQPNP